MGTYATYTSLQTVMIGTDFDTATTSLSTKMITHAENEVNKYLSKRYDITSFSTSTAIPPLVTSITETLSEGYMYQRMSRSTKEGMGRGKDLINQAIDNLKLISDYKMDLVNTAGSVILDMSDTSSRVLCNTDTYSTTFNEDDELNWRIDQDKLDDIDAGRD